MLPVVQYSVGLEPEYFTLPAVHMNTAGIL